jgi:hypothetical protein
MLSRGNAFDNNYIKTNTVKIIPNILFLELAAGEHDGLYLVYH